MIHYHALIDMILCYGPPQFPPLRSMCEIAFFICLMTKCVADACEMTMKDTNIHNANEIHQDYCVCPQNIV